MCFVLGVEDWLYDKICDKSIYRHFIVPVTKRLDRMSISRRMQVSGDSGWKEDRKVRFYGSPAAVDDSQVNGFEATRAQREILQQISGIVWYHSINLGHGVVTPGAFDHRPCLGEYRLPQSLEGKRVLDVATFDGFWAFEFEKRRAAEVLALDIGSFNDLDLPPLIRPRIPDEDLNRETGVGFNIVSEILGSTVKRKIMNVYELDPEKIGKFDFVFCSDLLLHLMNPMKALQQIQSVVAGYAYIVEPYDPELNWRGSFKKLVNYRGGSEKCIWWIFGLESLRSMIEDAGFKRVELINTFSSPNPREKEGLRHALFKAFPP